ncbi:MAG: 3-oxoadipate enol-lactonase [Gammaproteobacteria bacterium]|jgi:3-oxoadipate enol-lactonase
MAYIDVGQAQLWVEDTGGTGVPLVLLHAAAGHSACWVEQRPLFEAAGFRVVAFDMRGFGRTRCNTGEETTGSVAGDLAMLVEKLSLPRFCLLGTAYGGFGAIEYALDNPDSLHAVVISTSFGGLVDAEFAEVRKRHIRPDLMMLPTIERELGASYRANDPEGVHRFHAMEQGSYKAAGGRQAHHQPMTLPRLEGMKVPTLVIAGDEDLYAPPPVMRLFADRITGVQFKVLAGVGHSAYWEKPGEWNELVNRFLAQHF